MQKFDSAGPISANLDINAGRVHIIAGDRADTTVEVRPADPDRSRDVKAAEETSVAYDNGVLRIQTAPARYQVLGPTGAVEVTVEVPAGSRIEGRSGGSELRGEGPLGDVAFDGAYRHITVDEAASLRLTAVDGDVEVGRLNGPAEVSTARGDIRIAEALRGKVVLSTQHGGISVGAAAGVSAVMDAGTGHGRISNSLTNTGNAELEIHATTPNGDITARSR